MAALNAMCEMNWYITDAADQRARKLADKHYSREKIGTRQFTPPGRKLLLVTQDARAVWCTSWPFAKYVHRVYPDAWVCSLFRNESPILSSELIREAIAITRWKYGEPPASGMITMIDAQAVKSRNPGYCYKIVGFEHVGYTKQRRLHILQLLPENMPTMQVPIGTLWTDSIYLQETREKNILTSERKKQ